MERRRVRLRLVMTEAAHVMERASRRQGRSGRCTRVEAGVVKGRHVRLSVSLMMANADLVELSGEKGLSPRPLCGKAR